MNLRDLFAKDIHYIIPAFQRSYVWNKDKQWEPLWTNISNTTEDYIEQLRESNNENKAKQQTKPHFMGSIVIQQVPTTSKEIPKRKVIDGQQRIITLQLLLDAFQLVCENSERPCMKKPAKILSKFVTNDKDLFEDEYIFKVWPTKEDQDTFKHAMDNELPTEDFKKSLIVQAHEFFKSQVKEWLGDAPEQKIDSLVECITTMLEIAVVDLDDNDDPNIIFETLNARGTPLAQSDLIKNFVLHKPQNSKDDIWGNLNDKWYKKEVTQGRLFRPRLDMFFNYWLAMRTGLDVSPLKVYDTFCNYVDKQTVNDVMCEIRKNFEDYKKYEQTKGEHYGLGSFFQHMNVMRAGIITPVLFLLLSDNVGSYIRAFEALESFLIRRMICRYTTKDYNRLILELSSKLQDNLDKADIITIDFFKEQTADARKWPSDKDIQDKLMISPIYNLLTRGRLRLILEGIEKQLRTSKTEDDKLPKNLTIEHIMPVGWRKNVNGWPRADGIGDDERDTLINTIGNLTLVTQPLNSSMSNSNWEYKRKALQDHSVLMLNKELLDKPSWNENDIKKRSLWMASKISERWPGPDKWD